MVLLFFHNLNHNCIYYNTTIHNDYYDYTELFCSYIYYSLIGFKTRVIRIRIG
jgi:hypothetical protein